MRPMHRKGVLKGATWDGQGAAGLQPDAARAIDIVQPDDVMGDALIGEMMIVCAVKQGVAGLAISGPFVTPGRIGAQDFTLFATGVSHRGPYKDGPGKINGLMAIDGMVIEPGNLVIGDESGLLCAPYDHVAEVYDYATAKHQAKQKTGGSNRSG